MAGIGSRKSGTNQQGKVSTPYERYASKILGKRDVIQEGGALLREGVVL